jgi:hypothetical protein
LNEVKPIIVLEVTLMGFAALYPSYGLVRFALPELSIIF